MSMTLTVTPEPDEAPPRNRIQVVADDADTRTIFLDIEVRRDGVLLRGQPEPGANTVVIFDYDARYGQTYTYTVTATVSLLTVGWTEAWASMAAWTNPGADGWTLGAGETVESTASSGGSMYRDSVGALGYLHVTDPSQVDVGGMDLATGQSAYVVRSTPTTTTLETPFAINTINEGGSYTVSLEGGQANLLMDATGSRLSGPLGATPGRVALYPQAGWAKDAEPLTYAATAGGAAPAVFAVTAEGVWYHKGGIVYRTLPSGEANPDARYITAAGATVVSAALNSEGTLFAVTLSGASDTQPKIAVYSVATGNVVWQKTTYPGSTPGAPYRNVIFVGSSVWAVSGSGALDLYSSTGVLTSAGTLTLGDSGTVTDSANDGTYVYYATSSLRLTRVAIATPTTSTLLASIYGTRLAYNPADGYLWISAVNGINRRIRPYARPTPAVGPANAETIIMPNGADAYFRFTPEGSMWANGPDATRWTLVRYRKLPAHLGPIQTGNLGTASRSTAAGGATLDVEESWLVHPVVTELSVRIDPGPDGPCCGPSVSGTAPGAVYFDPASEDTVTYASRSTAHEIDGSDLPVVVTSGRRAAGVWTLILQTCDLVGRDALVASLMDEFPMLLNVPASTDYDLPHGWFSVGEVSESRVAQQDLRKPWRRVALPMQPVAEPSLVPTYDHSWADLLTENLTWQGVKDVYGPWLNVLTGEAL